MGICGGGEKDEYNTKCKQIENKIKQLLQSKANLMNMGIQDPKKTQEEMDKVTKLKREIDSEFKVLTDIYNHNLRFLPENGEKINAQTKKFNEVKNEVTKIDEASER